MSGRSRGWGFPFVALALLLMAGCGVNSQFVYKPGVPAAGVPKLPAKLAVLPFKDGTADFVQSGSMLSTETVFNLAKGGIKATVTAIPPELWSKMLADDMAASGRFRSVRFVYSSTEAVDEALLIEGTVTKAYWANSFDGENELALSLVGRRRGGKRVVWEKQVARQWRWPVGLYKGCGMGIQCMLDRHHHELNKAMQGMFAEAGADLAERLASVPGGDSGMAVSGVRSPDGGSAGDGTRTVAPAAGEAARPPGPESVEQTIDRILKTK